MGKQIIELYPLVKRSMDGTLRQKYFLTKAAN